MLDLAPSTDRATLDIRRPDLTTLPDLRVERLPVGGNTVTIDVDHGRATVTTRRPTK
jgi:hypothetical protein